MPTHNTKWFRSTMSGAPALTGQAGALLNVLDAVLINGFNLLTLDSLVVANDVATGTKTAHGYLLHQIIEIAGAAPAALNGKWRVTSVSANTFTFTTSGISDQTATGTITAKTPGAGWEVPFSGTNQKIYRSTSNMASGNHAVRVNDTPTTTATLLAAEDWTDISTPVNSISTQYLPKSSTADSTARGWFVVADDRSLFIGIGWNGGRYDVFRWGDFKSLVAGDGHAFEIRCALSASVTNLGHKASCGFAKLDHANDVVGYASRAYSQVVGPIATLQASMAGALWTGFATNSANTSISVDPTVGTYVREFSLSGHHGYCATAATLVSATQYGLYQTPNPCDGGIHFVPVFLFEGAITARRMRGTVRGLMHVMESLPFTADWTLFTGIEGVTSGLVLGIRTQNETLTYTGGSTRAYGETHIAIDLGDWT